MEWTSLLDHKPTSSPQPVQAAGLHHTACSVPQRVASGYLLAHEKGADSLLLHHGCSRRALSAKSLQGIWYSAHSQTSSYPATSTACSVSDLRSQTQDWKRVHMSHYPNIKQPLTFIFEAQALFLSCFLVPELPQKHLPHLFSRYQTGILWSTPARGNIPKVNPLPKLKAGTERQLSPAPCVVLCLPLSK